MRKIAGLFILCFVKFTTTAQDYSISRVPSDLLKGADIIKRNEVIDIEIKSIGKATIRHTYAYTILNDNADAYAEFQTYYDKFRSVEDIEGRLFDSNGKEVERVKKKDINDLSSELGMSISDSRYKLHNFHSKDYPFTVEYTEVNEYNGIFILPEWVPQLLPTMSVQESKLIVKTPLGYELRYKEYKYKGRPVISDFNGGKIYEWTLANEKAITIEPLMPAWNRERIRVALAPTFFEIDGYTGNMKNWQEFGKFRQQLIRDRDYLPEEIIAKAKQLISGLSDPYEKISVLYKFLQSNTRYISIQLGIGGWQPIPASKVAQSGYGDCKALSNYMAALLKVADLPSKYVVIKAGSDGFHIDSSFVSNQFNHVILCVPLKNDTVWLECTSSILPAGFLGSFTYNRPALIIDETGGTMVRTPNYRKNENLQLRKIEAEVDEAGNVKAKTFTRYTGLQQEYLHDIAKTKSSEDILKILRKSYDLPTYDVANFNYEDKPGRIPELLETVEFLASGFAQVSGKRLFISPNILSKSGVKLNADSLRKFDIQIEYEYTGTDTVQLKIPLGYEVESLPKTQMVKSKFGEYKCSFSFENDSIVYVRSMVKNNGRYPASDYQELVAFYQNIYKWDRLKIVLKKKE